MSFPEDNFILVDAMDELEPEQLLATEPPETLPAASKWLAPTDYDDGNSEYVKHLKSHLYGTGDWLGQTPEYRQWHDTGDSNVLWIKAVAGVGKSVLAAWSRSHIRQTENAPVLYFFFRHIVTSNRTPKQLVRDWLAQLLPSSDYLQRYIRTNFMERRLQLETISFETLWDLLGQTVAKLPRVYCFADALDEMSLGNDDFFPRLTELGKILSCRVFLTSRPTPHIVTAFRKVSYAPLQLVLGPEVMNEDISRYVDHRLERDISQYIDHRLAVSGMEFLNLEPDKPTTLIIREALKSQAQGSFLYARLMTDNLLEAIRKKGSGISKQDLSNILDALPTGLGDMYAGMLQDHAERTETPWKLQLSILQWVTHSERPLRLLELAAVIDFQRGSLDRSQHTKSVVRTACGPLLEILPSDVVGPIHHSFTEYLVNAQDEPPLIEPQLAHIEMSARCVEYLVHVKDQEWGPNGKLEIPFDGLLLKYPFLGYAKSYWHTHIRKAKEIEKRTEGWLDELLLQAPAPVIEALMTGSNDREPDWDDASPRSEAMVSPLHLAAAVGLAKYIEHLAAIGLDLEASGPYDETAMHYAARQGWGDAITSLFQAGADADPDNRSGLKPLHLAANRGHFEAVKALLAAGVDPFTPKTREDPGRRCGNSAITTGQTPLEDVCTSGHMKTFNVFIPYLQPKGLARCFEYALCGAKPEMRLAIIALDAFDPSADNLSQTPLHEVCYLRDLKCMEALLARRADANRGSKYSLTRPRQNLHKGIELPIHALCKDATDYRMIRSTRNKHTRLELTAFETRRAIKMLINAGNSVNAPNRNGETPLFLAQASRKFSESLLDLGADIKAVTVGEMTPLHKIALKPSMESNMESKTATAQFWLDHGIDINAKTSSDGRTALMLDLNNGNYHWGRSGSEDDRLCDHLLRNGADPNIKDKDGKTALHLSAELHNDEKGEIIHNLIVAGADVSAQTDEGDTALHHVLNHASNGESTKVLLQAGLDPNVRNIYGESALHKCSALRQEIVRVCLPELLQHGARIDARDEYGQTCIHHFWANSGHDVGVMRMLIEAGADPEWRDAKGNNSWHSVVEQRDHSGQLYPTVESFCTAQDKSNAFGQTPFFLAIASENTDLLKYLTAKLPDKDINCPDNLGRAAIHLAVSRSAKLVHKLVKLGVDIRRKTYGGSTALHFAAQARQPDVLLYLLTQVPDPLTDIINDRDLQGRSALDYAARTGTIESVDILLDSGAHTDVSSMVDALRSCTDFPEEMLRWDDEVKMRTAKDRKSGAGSHMNDAVQRPKDDDVARALSTLDSGKYRRGGRRIISCVQRLATRLRSIAPDFHTIVSQLDSRSKKTHEQTPIESLDTIAAKHGPELGSLVLGLSLLPIRIGHDDINGWNYGTFLEKMKTQSVLEEYERTAESFSVSTIPPSFVPLLANVNQRHLLAHIFLSVEPNPWGERFDCSNHVTQHLVSQGEYQILDRMADKLIAATPMSLLDEAGVQLQSSISGFLQQFDRKPNRWDALLVQACSRQTSNLPTVKLLLEKFPVTQHGRILAIFKLADGPGVWNICALDHILNLGADVNSQDSKGRTPLHVACSVSPYSPAVDFRQAVVKCLLRHGADPNILNDDGESCLTPDIDLLGTFLEQGAGVQSEKMLPVLNKAIRILDIQVIDMLIERGIDVNKQIPEEQARSKPTPAELESGRRLREGGYLDDSYPLHLAACMSLIGADNQAEPTRKRVVEHLLSAGADINLITKNGSPIAHEIAYSHNDSTVDRIMRCPGLNVQWRDSNGQDILLARAQTRGIDLESLMVLLSQGADIESVNLNGENMLHLWFKDRNRYTRASFPASADKLLQLCQTHRLTDSADHQGNRPIHHCLRSGSWEFAQALATYGAKFVPDRDGASAIHHLAGQLVEAITLPEPLPGSTKEPGDSETTISAVQSAEISREPTEQEKCLRISAWLKYFKDLGLDMNGLDNRGEPPLFRLLRTCPVFRQRDKETQETGFVRHVHLLVAAGASIHAKSPSGQNALHVLATARWEDDTWHWSLDEDKSEVDLKETWRYLEKEGVDPFCEDDEQRTPLDIAAVNGHLSILEMY